MTFTMAKPSPTPRDFVVTAARRAYLYFPGGMPIPYQSYVYGGASVFFLGRYGKGRRRLALLHALPIIVD